jgi:ATP-dependent RNA helicase RhlE
MPFRALSLDPKVLQAVQEAGYTEPTPIQAAAIPLILAGNDLIGIAQTGTGKTAAFTLPMLTRLAQHSGPQQRSIRALVLAPTRELVVQIDENVRAYGKHVPLRIATVFGGVGERPQIAALRDGTDLVVATPGRLLDLMARRFGDFSGLQYLVLDEADRMLDMGFLPSIRRIVKALPRDRQTLLFSATLSREIEELTREFQRSPKKVEIGRRSNPADTVTQLVYEVPKHLKPGLLAHLLADANMGSVLVFTRTKHGADRVARKLESLNIKTGTLHSNRSQNQRLRALNDFKAGTVRVLVATDIAARGIDVDGISHVVNFDFPMHPEDYVHRIGRTGRAQAIGDAISFVTSEDYSALRSLERFINRGIVRKKAEGFDYAAPAPPQSEGERPERRNQPRSSFGGGGQRNSGSRPGGSGRRDGGGQRPMR